MKNIALSLLIMFGLMGIAHADIFNPITPKNEKLTLTAPSAFDAGTLLTDAATIINYLGVKEGEAYSFGQHKWVTTTGATLISYPAWNVALSVTMLNADGVTGNIEWNLGNYLPVQNVPVMKYTQYLYVFGGAGGEENSEGTAFKFTSVIGAEFKFTF